MRFTNNHETVLETDQEFINAYLEYKNNFLTVSAFAAYHGWVEGFARHVIHEGRQLHNDTIYFIDYGIAAKSA